MAAARQRLWSQCRSELEIISGARKDFSRSRLELGFRFLVSGFLISGFWSDSVGFWSQISDASYQFSDPGPGITRNSRRLESLNGKSNVSLRDAPIAFRGSGRSRRLHA